VTVTSFAGSKADAGLPADEDWDGAAAYAAPANNIAVTSQAEIRTALWVRLRVISVLLGILAFVNREVMKLRA
jgi:hypothetical protein